MARRPPLPTPSAIRRRREHRTQRLLTNRVVRWHGEPYPPVTGIVMRVGRRRAFVPLDHIAEIDSDRVSLHSVRLDLRDFERREGEVVLNGDVVDHQLVDVDGVRVVRAADLYLARVGDEYRLV